MLKETNNVTILNDLLRMEQLSKKLSNWFGSIKVVWMPEENKGFMICLAEHIFLDATTATQLIEELMKPQEELPQPQPFPDWAPPVEETK